MFTRKKKAILALADGAVFEGWSIGAEGESTGEVVFNTSMTGYQEIITDPSYKGQIVTMTYPLIGNYGVNDEDCESLKPHLEGFIVKEYSPYPSNWRLQDRLDVFLRKNGIVGIEGIDTRSLTRHIRDRGEQQGVISTSTIDHKTLIERAKMSPSIIGRDLVKDVTTDRRYEWRKGVRFIETRYDDEKDEQMPIPKISAHHPILKTRFKVVALDCGVKFNILRMLTEWGCEVIVAPAFTMAQEILSLRPDGIVFSNGPGDPSAVQYIIESARYLIGKKPIMGICLGHQILALAMGCRTYKLKFGHHGGNQPVMDLESRAVEITAQNHCFAVDADSVDDKSTSRFGRVAITHINLNDKSVEGLACRDVPLFSVQYHPEASPGPYDANHLFGRFVRMMEEG